MKKNQIIKLLVIGMVSVSIFSGCGKTDQVDSAASTESIVNTTESNIEVESEVVQATEQEAILMETEVSETQPVVMGYDLKDYADIFPEDLGGNLAETLATLLYPDNPQFFYDDNEMMYIVGDGSIEVGASANNDGYFVWMFQSVEGFTIYGIEPGMAEADAVSILENQGIVADDTGYGVNYVIDDNHYITIDVVDGIVNRVSYAHYLG